MGERFYLRTMSDLGPMWYVGYDWTPSREDALDYEERDEALCVRDALCDEKGIHRSAVRIVRVGPPRRYTLTEKGRQATDTPPDDEQAAEKAPTRETGRETPAQGEGVGAPPEALAALARLLADPAARARFNAASGELVDRAIATLPPEHQPAARAFEAAAVRGERVPVTGTWCADSPVHEHAWQWRDGGLVCAHCGGRRVEAKA